MPTRQTEEGGWHCPEKHSLAWHADNLNERRNQRFRMVFVVSWLMYFPHSQQVWKVANIMYGKSSAGDYMN